jgi:hypothetical protein
LFLLSKWFQTKRFLWEFPIGQVSYTGSWEPLVISLSLSLDIFCADPLSIPWL